MPWDKPYTFTKNRWTVKTSAPIIFYSRGEGILPLLFRRDTRVVAWQSEARMASRRKGGTPLPHGHRAKGTVTAV